MPHAHCLFILKEKLLAARHIDTVVWAEIPCPRKFPILHAIVCKRMIHDPCDDNTDKPCLKKVGSLGVCYRRFPKQFNSVTTIIGATAILPVCVPFFGVAYDSYQATVIHNTADVAGLSRYVTVFKLMIGGWYHIIHTYCKYLIAISMLKVRFVLYLTSPIISTSHANHFPHSPFVLCSVAAHKRCFKYVYKYCFKAPGQHHQYHHHHRHH